MSRSRETASAALGAARALLLGGACAICRSWCDGGLCAPCEARHAPPVVRCPGCAAPLHAASAPRCPACSGQRLPWSSLLAGFDYAPPLDHLVAAFKFNGALSLARALLQPLRRRVRHACADTTGRPDCVVPVPLARERLRERGYNQSWEIARRLARAERLRACADALFRVRDTGRQLTLGRDARLRNLQGAFVVHPRRLALVRGARVALVDDVLTTGATAQAACECLRAAGAADVQVWVLARTPGASAAHVPTRP